MTPLDNITIEQHCLPLSDLHCIDLYFNDTESYGKFSFQYSDLINKLYDKNEDANLNTQNVLFIFIEYNTLTELSLDTFRSLDAVKNRTYHNLQFNLKNPGNQSTLVLNSDIANMTLTILQVNIFCGARGLYQYDYRPGNQRISPKETLECEIRVAPSTMAITSNMVTKMRNEGFSITLSSTASTKRNQHKLALIFSLVGGGSLIPCFLLACGLYTYCKRNDQENDINNEPRDSIPYSETDSISSDTTMS